jgi:hypothetical protein
MHNTLPIQLLREFQNDSLSTFDDFIRSPFFNKSKTVIKLWDVIKKYGPDYTSEKLEREKVFAAIFPGKKYNYGTMKNLLHSLNRVIERFLIQTELESSKFQQNYNLVRGAIVYNVSEFYKKRFDKFIEDYENPSKVLNLHFLEKLMMLEIRNALTGVESRTSKLIFDESDALLNFFFIKLFMVFSNTKSLKIDSSITDENDSLEMFISSVDLETMMKFIEQKKPEDFKITGLYYYMYLARKEPVNDEYFLQFKKALEHNEVNFGEFELSDLFTCLLNVSSERVYLGKTNSVKEKAEVLKLMLDRNIWFNANSAMISFRMFGTVLQALLAAEEFGYSEKFYKTYQHLLQEYDKENMDNYYYAHKYFFEGDFDRALEYSSRIKPELDHYKNHIKDIQLKSYFEQNDYGSFEYCLDAYRQFIYRNKTISEKNRQFYINYFNALNSLFKYKISPDSSLDEIKFMITSNKMWDKEWIIKKTNEIENK